MYTLYIPAVHSDMSPPPEAWDPATGGRHTLSSPGPPWPDVRGWGADFDFLICICYFPIAELLAAALGWCFGSATAHVSLCPREIE